MKKGIYKFLTKSLVFTFLLCLSFKISAQQMLQTEPKREFWKRVQFGGGFGLSIGSGYTDVTLAPSAIYNLNQYVAIGVSLQGSRVAIKNQYSSWLYGGSLIALFNPIEEVQLSVELEEVRVNNNYELISGGNFKDNFWNTGLFVGGGYRAGDVVIGARYNVLFNKDNYVYSEALMPFIRVYF
jgi:hypothetical protein